MRKSSLASLLAPVVIIPVAACSHSFSAEGGALPPSAAVAFEDAGAGGPPLAAHPSFPQTVMAASAPPPISGGTLLVTQDGKNAVVADPDRDAIYVAPLSQGQPGTITLNAGDEPGRVVEDAAGRIHVALRGAGAVATIDPVQLTVVDRTAVCPAPRGLAFDASSNTITVACATGELVTLSASGGAPTRTVKVARDLRDVVIQNGAATVSSFRAATLLRLNADGTIGRTDALSSPDSLFLPHVVWRTVAGPSGTLVTVHQAETTNSLDTTTPGGYGAGGGGLGSGGGSTGLFEDGGFLPFPVGVVPEEDGSSPAASDDGGAQDSDGGVVADGSAPDAAPPTTDLTGNFAPGINFGAVMSVCSTIGPDGTVLSTVPFNGVLPVDVAVSPDGSRIAIAAPGSAHTQGLYPVVLIANGVERGVDVSDLPITSVAFDPNGDVIAFSREPAQLRTISFQTGSVTNVFPALAVQSREDTGHDVFHTQAGALIACASCHPEGGDDGHVWMLDGAARRTPSLRGTIAGTAPYHWPGDESDMNVLVTDVYSSRMSGGDLDPGQMTAITSWVQSIPAPPAPSWLDSKAVAAGKAIFERTDTQCTTCHAGSKLTNNQTVDVGTGQAFQVPPLVGIGWRAPFLHDGCANTLADRFGSCNTVAHGQTAQLTSTDLANLIAYLESL
jgi:mono/diheme cytochrome c family protein